MVVMNDEKSLLVPSSLHFENERNQESCRGCVRVSLLLFLLPLLIYCKDQGLKRRRRKNMWV